VAINLGASEEHVTVEQIRMAIATWYMHLDREETSRQQLMSQAHRSIVRGISDRLAVALHGGAGGGTSLFAGPGQDRRPKPLVDLWPVVFLGSLSLALSFVTVWVAKKYQSETCEESLNYILYWTGVVSVLTTLCACVAEIARARGYAQVACFVLSPTLLLMCVLLGELVTGFSWTARSSPSQCGIVLWEMCNVVYKVIPTVSLATVLCGPCCAYCCLHGAVMSELQHAEEGLMEP